MESKVKAHYNSKNLTEKIKDAIIAAGKDPTNLSINDLSGIDQLHSGGIKASLGLFEHLSFSERSFILDAGCGIGGSSRLLAKQFNCNVVGVDLTDEFIHAARFLTCATHLEDQVQFQQGSVLDLQFDNNTFNGVLCQHILMNISDKAQAVKEFYRILKPGGKLIFHEITKGENDNIQYPVPWAAHDSISFLRPWYFLKNILKKQGFNCQIEADKSQNAIALLKKVNAVSRNRTHPTNPLNQGLIFGTNSKFFGKNMAANFQNHAICLIEAVYKKEQDD